MVIWKKLQIDSFPKEFFVEVLLGLLNYKSINYDFFVKFTEIRKYTPNSKRLGVHNYKTFSLENMTKELGVLLDKYVQSFLNKLS